MTVMNVDASGGIGVDVHSDGDQFLLVVAGKARVQMGPAEDDLPFERDVEDDSVILPAGTWHNLRNIGTPPMHH
jgi:mannose-6-phosphate isomerase-like protein (cupin superfamily)